MWFQLLASRNTKKDWMQDVGGHEKKKRKVRYLTQLQISDAVLHKSLEELSQIKLVHINITTRSWWKVRVCRAAAHFAINLSGFQSLAARLFAFPPWISGPAKSSPPVTCVISYQWVWTNYLPFGSVCTVSSQQYFCLCHAEIYQNNGRYLKINSWFVCFFGQLGGIGTSWTHHLIYYLMKDMTELQYGKFRIQGFWSLTYIVHGEIMSAYVGLCCSTCLLWAWGKCHTQ